MFEVLLWIYILNATLETVHEIDSAYWKEWQLFKLPGGIAFFLGLHIILVFKIIAGRIWLGRQNTAGLVISLILSAGGIAAFLIHNWFIRQGHPEL